MVTFRDGDGKDRGFKHRLRVPSSSFSPFIKPFTSLSQLLFLNCFYKRALEKMLLGDKFSKL